jgi:hypothetical protein
MMVSFLFPSAKFRLSLMRYFDFSHSLFKKNFANEYGYFVWHDQVRASTLGRDRRKVKYCAAQTKNTLGIILK